MELFVTFQAFETINEPEDVQRVRGLAGESIQRLQKSGHLVDGRVFADQRGGFLLLDVDDGVQLQELLGGAMLDHYSIETHPTATFEDLARFFEQDR